MSFLIKKHIYICICQKKVVILRVIYVFLEKSTKMKKISSLYHNWNDVLRRCDGTNMDTRQNNTDESLCV